MKPTDGRFQGGKGNGDIFLGRKKEIAFSYGGKSKKSVVASLRITGIREFSIVRLVF